MIRQRLLAIAGLSWALCATAAPAQGDTGRLKAEGPAVIDEKVPDLPLPDSFFAPEVCFADQHGPFVLAGRNSDPKDSRALFDLRDGKQVGALAGKIEHLEKPHALSPDGKLYACAGGFR